MTHFTDAELMRWSDRGPGSDRDRVMAHVAACGACAARYAAAVRTRALADGEAHAEDIHAFTEAGRRIVPPSPRVVPFRQRVAWIAIPLAAAAGIVIAVAVSRRDVVPRSDTAPVLRGGTLHTIAPSGETTTDARFEWASGASAARYKITVGAPAGPIYTFIARSSPAAMPDQLRSLLVPGTQYWWTVTALDAGGRVFLVAERRPFTIRTR
jgi:anti-sigma factor RsiW